MTPLLPRIVSMLACAALLAGCPESPPLLVLRGELQGAPPPEKPDHLALVWLNYDLRSSHSQWATTQEIPIPATLPYEYTFNVYEKPPAAAMTPNEPGDGQFAIGVLLAYRDTNHNGVLDTIPSGSGPIDQVLGTSEPFYVLSAAEYYEVWYVEGTPPSYVAGLQQGFNLRGASGLVPKDTRIPIPVHPAAVNNLYLCEAIDSDQGANMALWNACLGPGPLRVFGNLTRMSGADDVYIELYSGAGEIADAQVTVNGTAIPYDAVNHIYATYDPSGAILLPGADNEIRVLQTGQQEVPIAVRLDGDFSITSPAAAAAYRWDASIPMAWTASAGATRYRLLEHTNYTTEWRNRWFWADSTAFTIPPLAADPGIGPLTTRLSARTLHQTCDDNGTDVGAMNTASVTVSRTR